MRTLVKRMSSFGILKIQMIAGAILMLAAVVVPPVGILIMDASLLLNPFLLGTVIVVMLIFGALAYFLFIRPFFIYRSLPEVLAESDGEFLYIHGKKQAKIPLSELADATVFVSLPFLFSKEIVAALVVHLISEKYGDLVLEVPGYGSYRMRLVSDVQKTANELMDYLSDAQVPAAQ